MKPTRKPARLDEFAAGLRLIIGPKAFVRRDVKGRALFVSDYPRFCEDPQALSLQLCALGFYAQLEGGMALMDWSFEGYRAFFDSLPRAASQKDCGLARLFDRHACNFHPGMLLEARRALMLWDAGKTGELRALAGASLATSLRKKEAPPAFYPALLRA